MGTPLGPKYLPYTYMDPLGKVQRLGSQEILMVVGVSLTGNPKKLAASSRLISPLGFRVFGLGFRVFGLGLACLLGHRSVSESDAWYY